jgi:hypothetical protein
MRKQLSIAGLSLVAMLGTLWLVGCEQTTTALEDRKARENAEEIQAYIAAKGWQSRVQDLNGTGVFYLKTTTVPNSETVSVGAEVKFFVVATRFDGVVIDSTDGKNPIVYTWGTDAPRTRAVKNGSYLYTNITSGMIAGLIAAGEGERVTLLVPSYYDTGRYGTLTLPQYSPIRYDMRIVSIRTETEQINDYIRANKIAVTDTVAGGLKIAKTRTRPDSALITAGQSVTVNYTGRLLDGTQFDSRTDSSFSFVMGRGENVQAWEQGLLKVRRGEKFYLISPSSLGFGPSGDRRGGIAIPPYASLSFEIEIVKVASQ